MKRLLLLAPIAAIAAFAASALGAGGHGQPSGVSIKPLAHATIGEKVRARGAGIQLRTNGPRDVLTASIAVQPKGSFGWHSHPGPVLVSVERGTFSLTQVEKGSCRTHLFRAGDAFVEDGGRVHLGKNAGPEPVRITATFLAHVGTTEFSKPEAIPEPCR
jgi:quercetin dioxygenase-like cupin family protein